MGQLQCVQCPLCSEVTVTRYLSPLEQQMVTQVVTGLSNVTFLSIQAVASNELGRREADMGKLCSRMKWLLAPAPSPCRSSIDDKIENL